MKTPPRFQLIQLYSNGDCLYATTVARQLKHDFPHCHLTWIIEENCRNILRNNPDVDTVQTVSITDKKLTLQVIGQLKKEAMEQISRGVLDAFFVTHIAGDNYARYDGTVRSSIYRNFPYLITVDTTPVLLPDQAEQAAARSFAALHRFDNFKNIILYECAPLSGQLAMNDAHIASLAEQLAAFPDTCVVLSSLRKITTAHPAVFDGSMLSLRETAALTHYCTHLLGSSSGITWISTSSGAKPLPMVQILDRNAFVFNPPSLDFEQRGKSTDHIIELYDFTSQVVVNCFQTIFGSGFASARATFNQPATPRFRLFRGIVHQFLKQGKIGKVIQFIKLNIQLHGWNAPMLKMMAKGICYFPVQIILDKLSSRVK